jgi:hypothetical protein
MSALAGRQQLIRVPLVREGDFSALWMATAICAMAFLDPEPLPLPVLQTGASCGSGNVRWRFTTHSGFDGQFPIDIRYEIRSIYV